MSRNSICIHVIGVQTSTSWECWVCILDWSRRSWTYCKEKLGEELLEALLHCAVASCVGLAVFLELQQRIFQVCNGVSQKRPCVFRFKSREESTGWICRDKAADVLKEEVDEMRRREKRNAVDLNYVKGVLVSGFESNELSVRLFSSKNSNLPSDPCAPY